MLQNLLINFNFHQNYEVVEDNVADCPNPCS